MDHILVTGGAGFIGSHLTDSLLADGHMVTVVDWEAEGIKKENLTSHENLNVFHWDINALSPMTIFQKPIDYVVHLAAQTSIVPSINKPVQYYETNVTGTLKILELCRFSAIKKIIYAASSSCYGDRVGEEPITEDHPCSPQYPYALTKYLGEQLVQHWGHVYKLPWISLRLFNVYGPRARITNDYGAVFGTFLAQKLHNKPLTIVGDGLQKRDFIHVKDVISLIKKAMHSKISNGVFNVGSSDPKSIMDIVDLLGPITTVKLRKRPGEPNCTWADISKAYDIFKWTPQIKFESGVRDMLKNIEYWRNAPVWSRDSIACETDTWFKYLGDN